MVASRKLNVDVRAEQMWYPDTKYKIFLPDIVHSTSCATMRFKLTFASDVFTEKEEPVTSIHFL